MFSFLEDVTYEFPEPFPLKKLLADVLERNVDEKYYIKTEKAEKLIKDLIARNILPSCCDSLNEEEQDVATSLDTYPDNKEDSVITNPQIKQIGNLVERENYANPQVGRVYAGNGVAPTLSTMQGGDRQPKVIVKSNICIDDTQGVEDKPRVYNNTAPSLRSQRSGLKTIVAMRGRYVDPNGNKETKQQLEPQMNGTCNALTTVQKDNLVLENTVINDRGFKDKEPQISQGYAPTLRAESHGNLPKVVEKVGQISNDGSQCGTVFSDRGLAPTIVAGCHGYANQHVYTAYRIRKLTPLECFRLMGVSDDDALKMMQINSNTQCYKQAGNSIVVDVMVEMFKNLHINNVKK